MMDDPSAGALLATVVVPVRGRRAELEPLIRGLEEQTLDRGRFEVMIADDGSPEDLATLNTADGWLRVSTAPPVNSYAARNRAARLARGDVLVFCDADCTPEPDWLEEGLAALRSSAVVVGMIRWRLPPQPSLWSLLEIELFVDSERAVRERRCLGGNLFVRRDIFEELGGFDESLPSGGDSDFGRRAAMIGESPAFARSAVVWHPATNRRADLLAKVRRVNRAAGIREVRRGGCAPIFRKPAIPVLTFARARRSASHGIWLDRRRLAEAGVRPSLFTQARAVACLYLVVPPVARRARRNGAREGRDRTTGGFRSPVRRAPLRLKWRSGARRESPQSADLAASSRISRKRSIDASSE